MSEWAIIVHGGAKDIPPGQEQAHRDGCLAALRAGQAILEGGGSALAAVEAATRALEDDPTFNAGYGAVVNAKGEVELDAAIMDGKTLAVGGVAAVTTLRHPVSVAAAMLPERPVLLVGDGAEAFARDHGGEFCAPSDLLVERVGDPGCDTVGCVALDRYGDIAAATSTGGLSGSHPGRVGDSPLPGCGLYADNAVGGVSLSGEGESLIRTTLAARLMRALEALPPGKAIDAALTYLARVGGEAGLIVIDTHGRLDWGHNSARFAVAHASAGQPAQAFVNRAEDARKDPS
ncbi:isoaspartyl peptidase/L-asparaginase family protein [Caulobacter sp. RL271]|jgi:beta-aspartyl-peptidase (threonine type)|uniref:Isoaspartyl peptidase/L-asparaginase family protein n=1 Tax=Caulobacter segnis TaxID=88688 RepID=A0ABY4ZRW9_9CAUL|nr:isoaspartyl peptidase/L-asparaginase family protein [Caulobacter segnis]USQ95336.1 isoaspartyl peptidase/L-asparaginase family protein [Caulobacter segnis]